MASYNLRVNGEARVVDVDPDTPMLYVLRDNLALKGPKFGCGLAQCGACVIHVDGEATRSCVLPVEAVKDRAIITLEGLGTSAKPSKLQQAFIDEQAAQCGYCANGMIMTSAALLAKTRNPSESEIRAALTDNLCRCGTHQRIVAAVKRAAAACTGGAHAASMDFIRPPRIPQGERHSRHRIHDVGRGQPGRRRNAAGAEIRRQGS